MAHGMWLRCLRSWRDWPTTRRKGPASISRPVFPPRTAPPPAPPPRQEKCNLYQRRDRRYTLLYTSLRTFAASCLSRSVARCGKASDRRLVRPTVRGALLGLEIGTSHATLPVGAGRFGPIWENPTYSAFWRVFGVTCLRMQRLASSVGFGATARLGPGRIYLGLGC
jgi:hypothetical protein